MFRLVLDAYLPLQQWLCKVIWLCKFASFIAVFVGFKIPAEAKYTSDLISTSGKHANIFRVFNTGGRLWLYKAAHTNAFTEQAASLIPPCIFIRKINISEREYYFTQEMETQEDKFTQDLYGEFSSTKSPRDTMIVSYILESDKLPFKRMRLVYSKQGCSVFKTTFLYAYTNEESLSTTEGCEMYARDCNGSICHLEECEEFFKHHCNQEVPNQYKTSCINLN
uniref:Lipocalin/cytosolic fatty-acid binding domain-containing protein n=1 Tax=Amblyomma maculatum TaxID=34609 RepID=G3MR63_AMBMU